MRVFELMTLLGKMSASAVIFVQRDVGTRTAQLADVADFSEEVYLIGDGSVPDDDDETEC